MKHLKINGLALVAVAAFMAFTASASAAPTLTSPAGVEYTGTLEATASSSLLFKASFWNVTCTSSTAAGSVTTNDETHARGSITTLSFSGCSITVDPLKNADGTYGSLTMNQKGEVFGFNTKVTMLVNGMHCIFGTSAGGTKLGTLTGGTPAKLALSTTLPLLEGSAFVCGSTGTLSGTYTVTKPGTVLVA